MKNLFQKIYFIVILLLLLSQYSIGQTMEEKVELLKRENDSLKLELENCLNSPARTLLDIEQRILNTPPQKNEESFEEFREKTLGEIKNKSEEKYRIAQSIIESTDEFLLLCNSIKEEMIERTGGYDETRNIPIIGYKNKEIIGKVLIEEGKGEIVKNRIKQLRQKYLSVIDDSKYFTEKIILTIDDWKPEKYVGLPLAIIFPTITQRQTDAKNSEKIILEFLNK